MRFEPVIGLLRRIAVAVGFGAAASAVGIVWLTGVWWLGIWFGAAAVVALAFWLSLGTSR
mgnify:CR=1 FL=1